MAKARVGYLCKHIQPHSHVGDGFQELEGHLSKLSPGTGLQSPRVHLRVPVTSKEPLVTYTPTTALT